jgi:Tol biopolymer transport system component
MRWVAYWSDESGRREVYVVPFHGAGKWQVSTSGGTYPIWRKDGKELFFYIEPQLGGYGSAQRRGRRTIEAGHAAGALSHKKRQL